MSFGLVMIIFLAFVFTFFCSKDNASKLASFISMLIVTAILISGVG